MNPETVARKPAAFPTLKGWQRTAQGTAQGTDSGSSVPALKGRNRIVIQGLLADCFALSGLGVIGFVSGPRAAPWAFLFRPFRALNNPVSWLRSLNPWLALVALLTAVEPLEAQADEVPVTGVARVLGAEIFAVARVDLTTADVPALVRRMVGKLADEEDVRGTITALGGWSDALKKAGAKELIVLFDAADMPGLPVVAVPLATGADGRAIAGVLVGAGVASPFKLPASETIGDVVVAGTPTAVARIRAVAPFARPELGEALAASGGTGFQVAIIPSVTQRRALEESLAKLPAELGGGPIGTVTQGMRWAAFELMPGPDAKLLGVVQARDAAAAVTLRKILQAALDFALQRAGNDPAPAALTTALGEVKPEVRGDRVTLAADVEKSAELVALPIRRAREATRFTQCVKHLKQIGLAMHNYHSAHNTFPPAFSASKEGKPLLSWRVHLLPYLDAKSLFDEFRRDEPWDSPHNQGLISRMPSFYACPSARPGLANAGKTTYLTPRGPATIFPGAQGVKIQDITDGTVNTILVVDAGDAAAVTWTKPDDWDVVPEFKTQGLFGHHTRGTHFLFGDGGVRFLKEAIKPKLLQAMSTGNGGEVIDVSNY